MEYDQITNRLFIEDAPERADFMLVLGAANRVELARRVSHAVDLYRAGYSSRILFSGGSVVEGDPEAMRMAALARVAGIPEDSILVESQSRSTFENAVLSRELLEERGSSGDTLLLVTSGWHMRRSWLTMRRSFPDHRILCCPTRDGCTRETWTSDAACRRLVREEARLLDMFIDAGLLSDAPRPRA